MSATADLISAVAESARLSLSSPAELIGLLAAGIAGGLVIVSSFVKTMIPLRWLAVGSNLGFMLYGAMHPALLLLLLHATLLPINLYRVVEMTRLTRRVTAVARGQDRSGVWLRPYMRSDRLAASTVLFHKGDTADRLYLLAEGRVEFVEIGQSVEPGTIFGEIAFFAPEHRRALTARCVDDCIVLSIDESTVKQLYYQNPAFGFELVGLIAGRLSADIQRLERQLQQAATA